MPKIFFATNRGVKYEASKSGKNFGDRFNTHGPQCFRVGDVEVTLAGKDPKQDSKWKVGRCTLYPEKLKSGTPSEALLGSKAMFEGLREHLKESPCDVLIYLHGFANDFPNTARRAAALQKMYSSAANPLLIVMFSWPSNGEVFLSYNYFSDREDAEVSGIVMARALQRFAEFLVDLRASDFKTLTAARRGRHRRGPPPMRTQDPTGGAQHVKLGAAPRAGEVRRTASRPSAAHVRPCLPDGGGRG